MQIDFSSSGGVSNQELSYRADTDNMNAERAGEITALVESSGVFDLRHEDINPNVTVGRADVITYRLAVSDGDRQTNLWLNDVTAPASIRPLLAYLQKLAQEQKSAG
ncbi:MAG TPA: protealysin inhibitor emfourin [Anaerolineales bacterium]|nr:protealysin inhibitor emfourin [Anaerolineales bacterium]